MVRRCRLIMQQGNGRSDMAESEIGQAVVVIIGPRQAATDVALAKVGARLSRNLPEAAPAVSQEQLRLLRSRNAADLLVIPLHVTVGNGEIKVAVKVCIKEDGAEFEAVQS